MVHNVGLHQGNIIGEYIQSIQKGYKCSSQMDIVEPMTFTLLILNSRIFENDRKIKLMFLALKPIRRKCTTSNLIQKFCTITECPKWIDHWMKY